MSSAKTSLRPSKVVTDPKRASASVKELSEDLDESNTAPVPWYRTTLAVGLMGSLLLFAALPALSWSWLAWVAPLPWLWLILQPTLPGRRPHLALYLVGFAFWMGTLHWLRLPHWATNFGWAALSGYLAVYIWAFVALSRVGVHRLGISIVITAPIVWTGLEVVRGYMLGGFTMSSLAHTQYKWLEFIQLADVIGCYGLSGLLMLATASLARVIPWAGQRITIWPLATIVAAVAIPLLYGSPHVNSKYGFAGPTVALIQGTFDTTFDYDPDEDRRVMAEYVRLTSNAVDEFHKRTGSSFDLVVWPESMFRSPLLSFSDSFREPEGAEWSKEQMLERSHNELRELAKFTNSCVLVGLGREHLTNDRNQRWNSAAFVNRDGEIDHYDKQKLVMFGEYVPFFDLWPALYQLTPMGEGLSRGERPRAFEVFRTPRATHPKSNYLFSPSICFETVVPHLIRNQVHQLRDEGAEPDVLVNLTNDGWFWGSSELELHMICGVFRAVEVRKPLVIAANTGISAHIDASGRIVKQAPRREATYLIADVRVDERPSVWLEHGGRLEILYLLPLVGLTAVGLAKRRTPRDSIACARRGE
jgi:apolipoprotein N-acyltransferase